MLEELTPAEVAVVASLRTLPDLAGHADGAEVAEAAHVVAVMARLLQLAVAQLWLVFAEAGTVDFVEVAQRALLALGTDEAPTELALQLDYVIRHLLVDEFQDTSPLQTRLLARLTAGWQEGDGRTLFVVGDPMQSIYRFRKADVGMFLSVAESGIGGVRLERLRLYRNNRSCSAVIDWINRAFDGLFPPQDEVASGAIRYRPCCSSRSDLDALAGQEALGVQVHALVDGARGADGEDGKDREGGRRDRIGGSTRPLWFWQSSVRNSRPIRSSGWPYWCGHAATCRRWWP